MAIKTLEELITEMNAQDIAPVVRAIHGQESSGGKADTSKANSSGAIGPMQVTPGAFQDAINKGYLPKTAKITDTEDSMRAGIAYLMEASKIHKTTDPAILGAYYHGGPRAVENARLVAERMKLDDPLGKTTGSYASDIASRVAQMQGAAPQQPRVQDPRAMTHSSTDPMRDQTKFRAYMDQQLDQMLKNGQRREARIFLDAAKEWGRMNGWMKPEQETENGN